MSLKLKTMDYAVIADSYEKIEATTKRLEMTDYLVELLKKTPKEVIARVVYLTQGKLYPDFVGIEMGVAEKLAIKALTRASGQSESVILSELQKSGDIGQTTQKILCKRKQSTFFTKKLTVERVYETLDKLAKTSGQRRRGHQDGASLRHVNRRVAVGSEMAYPNRHRQPAPGHRGHDGAGCVGDCLWRRQKARELIERAYNISSDLGRVANVVAEKGLEGIEKFQVMVFEPIRPMLAERLGVPEEILEKFGGKCVAEYKYDGERVQAHKKGDKVVLFSRRLENISRPVPRRCGP